MPMTRLFINGPIALSLPSLWKEQTRKHLATKNLLLKLRVVDLLLLGNRFA